MSAIPPAQQPRRSAPAALTPPPAASLPTSRLRYGLTDSVYERFMDKALPLFAAAAASPGSSVTVDTDQLKSLGKEYGVASAHPLVTQPVTAYEECLRYSLCLLWPPATHTPESLAARSRISRQTPAQAVRGFVTETYRRFTARPDAVQLLVAENLFDVSNLRSRLDVLEASPVVLHLDNVLMHGHDVGAFRYGVSAEDVWVLITAICSFPMTQGGSFYALYGMDATDTANSQGMLQLACDAVLAFLTTNMPTEQGSSYTHASDSITHGASVGAALYDRGTIPTEEES